MSDKPKVGFYWCASCGGCEESVVDLAEDILAVVEAVDIVFWPVAMDFKKDDVSRMPDGSLAAMFINGAVRTSEQEEMTRLLRKKSRLIVAYGSCAHLGGIPGLANQFDREAITDYVYQNAPSVVNEAGIRPAKEHRNNGSVLKLPGFHEQVRALNQVIDVDYYLPGCPPTPALLKNAVFALLEGSLPPKGSVLAPDVALCEQCSRKDSKPANVSYDSFSRVHWTEIDPEKCFLAQGIVCMGPATRAGCEALCIEGHMPCTGCFGGTSRNMDQGGKMLSSICSAITARDERGIDETLNGIPDPAGTFYRYALPASILRQKRRS